MKNEEANHNQADDLRKKSINTISDRTITYKLKQIMNIPEMNKQRDKINELVKPRRNQKVNKMNLESLCLCGKMDTATKSPRLKGR
ncbi:MAG: hypothetical protein RAP70_11345 [Candidatus Celaenobacter antarcticus]|nr:hypothetical protein [Candidatus Celaenobacter antarcticus]